MSVHLGLEKLLVVFTLKYKVNPDMAIFGKTLETDTQLHQL